MLCHRGLLFFFKSYLLCFVRVSSLLYFMYFTALHIRLQQRKTVYRRLYRLMTTVNIVTRIYFQMMNLSLQNYFTLEIPHLSTKACRLERL